MKKHDSLAIIGLLLMGAKSNSFIVEGTAFYHYTNVMGALLFIGYLLIQKQKKFVVPTVFYAMFNLLLHFTDSYQVHVMPLGSDLFLLLDLVVYLFPILAFFYYLSGFETEELSIRRARKCVKASLVLALISVLLLFTGVFAYYALFLIMILVLIVIILEGIALMFVISQFFKEVIFKQQMV